MQLYVIGIYIINQILYIISKLFRRNHIIHHILKFYLTFKFQPFSIFDNTQILGPYGPFCSSSYRGLARFANHCSMVSLRSKICTQQPPVWLFRGEGPSTDCMGE